MTRIPCSRHPPSTTTALSPLTAGTTLSGMLPSSTASPTASRRTPVGKGEVKTEVCASTTAPSSTKRKRVNRQKLIKCKRPHKPDATNLLGISLQCPPVNYLNLLDLVHRSEERRVG